MKRERERERERENKIQPSERNSVHGLAEKAKWMIIQWLLTVALAKRSGLFRSFHLFAPADWFTSCFTSILSFYATSNWSVLHFWSIVLPFIIAETRYSRSRCFLGHNCLFHFYYFPFSIIFSSSVTCKVVKVHFRAILAPSAFVCIFATGRCSRLIPLLLAKVSPCVTREPNEKERVTE